MKEFAKVLDQHAYYWVPIVCFFVFLLVGAFIGFFKGWKKGLYYLAWEVVALVLAVFATKPLLQTALKGVDTSNMSVDLKQFFFDHKALMPIVMIAWFIILKPIARIIAIPFRKLLVANDMQKTFKWRLLGAGISMVGALPVTAFSANAFTLISGKNFFSPATDGLTYGLTFGQYNGISNDVADIKATLEVGSDDQLQNQFKDMFSGSADFSTMTPENRATIQTLLNGNNLPLIIQNASSDLKTKIADVATNGISGAQDQGANKFDIDASKWETISSVLKNQYGWSDSDIKILADNYLVIK